MFATQLLSPELLVMELFYGLCIVGASLAGLGWFLFANTASNTPRIPRPQLVYGIAADLVGINILLAVTFPVHRLYWTHPPEQTLATAYAVVVPSIGYWL